MREDGAAHMTLSTFYKYVSILNLKRSPAISRRKNHSPGIRATAPFQIFDRPNRIQDRRSKEGIYLPVQDNYSRAILAYQLSTERRPLIPLKTLQG